MDFCLLCLELNKDILNCIRINSIQWQELDITKTIEKYFWSLNPMEPNSWICVSCWKEVSNFHNFYMRIEEAHMNFCKVKVEGCAVSLENKGQLAVHKTESEGNKRNNVEFCFLEPEIPEDQNQQLEPDLQRDNQAQFHELIVNNEAEIVEKSTMDTSISMLKKTCKRIKLSSKDPLEESKKSKKKKSSKVTVIVERKSKESRLKNFKLENPKVIKNDNNLDSLSDHPNKNASISVERKRRIRKDHDEFIAKHFKNMLCDLCQIRFENFFGMQQHFTEIHKQRGYVFCCKRKFFDRTRLVDHLHCHLNPNHFKCNECGKAMSDRIRLVNHMLRVHRANEVVKQHCCDVCGKSFTEAYVLRTHKLTHLPEEEKKFHCSDCGKNYGSSYLLNQHRQVVHLKRFVKICYICGKAINSSAEFKVHMNKHEGIPPPVVNCDVCGLRLTSERSLKLHKATQHPVGGKKDHPCPVCGKISPTARALKKHINTMHEKGSDHKCTVCEKSFRRPETLKEHMASHTGNPLYVCPWCPKTFFSNGNMHAHRKNKHPKEYLELKLQRYN